MLPLRKFEKNRMAHFRELDLILDFGYIEPNTKKAVRSIQLRSNDAWLG